MIRAVIFDLGKVLVDFDYDIAAPRISARSRMSAPELMRFLSKCPLLVQYETGLLTSEEFYRQISAATGFTGSFDEFSGFFGDIFTPIAPMVALHASLRRQKVPTYIFSNTNDLAIRHVRRAFPFFQHFDGFIFSYEHHSMKPDAKLYEAVEAASGLRGADLLYLDDRAENVAAGAARGWQAILHKTPEQSWAAVRKLGLLDPGTAR